MVPRAIGSGASRPLRERAPCVALELAVDKRGGVLASAVADVSDRQRMDHILESLRPELIFHAAAPQARCRSWS